jgi:hypothetical protein
MKEIKQISDTIIEVDGVQYQVREVEEQPEPPKVPRWEYIGEINGYYVNTSSLPTEYQCPYRYDSNRNTFPTREHEEASIALAQLLQLRDSKFYRNGWKPDWSDEGLKYSVTIKSTELGAVVFISNYSQEIFSFQDEETATRFMNDQAELLNIYKQLFD